MQKLKKLGILGINRRNLDFIYEHNQRKFYPVADSKIATKNLARKVGVETPDMISCIRDHSDVKKLESILSQQKSFVIKPDHGMGGGGIIVIEKVMKLGFVKSSGEIISLDDLKFHCQNILSGMYSLGGQADSVLIESLVAFDPVFSEISYQGVPDVRVIVLEGSPLMGMLRLPTKTSDGKANLHIGGIGVGIDLETGVTTKAIQFNKLIDVHPETGQTLSGRKIPHWKRILELATIIQKESGLGYIGVDIVLDKNRGPLVLEINVRPGISIQLCNGHGICSKV
jgi:alpha-L-glutamate ligase-like protein